MAPDVAVGGSRGQGIEEVGSHREGGARETAGSSAAGTGGGEFSPMAGAAFGPQFRRTPSGRASRRARQKDTLPMKCALVGSRYFGATVFEALRKEAASSSLRSSSPAADDRLALAAQAAGVPVHVLANPKIVPGEAIAEGTDLIVAAHTHARVSHEALARSRLGGIGYHPSLLPRHRGIAAVEWTILEGDPIAGGSVYHLADGWDAGAIAAQDWCFVAKRRDRRASCGSARSRRWAWRCSPASSAMRATTASCRRSRRTRASRRARR